MKIGIDTFGSDNGQSGLGSYIYYLTASLKKREGLDYALFGAGVDRYTYSNNIPFIEAKCGDSLIAQSLWHVFNSAAFYKKQKMDAVLYCAAEKMLPFNFKTPGVAVINDTLSVMMAKSKFPRRFIYKSLSRVQKIIVPTNFLKNDLLSLGLDRKKILVVRHGIDHSCFYQHPMVEAAAVDVKPFAIKRPYIIYPSRISGPGKKHIELIEAFNAFKKRTGLPHRLVLAGREDEWGGEVHTAAFASPYASDIFITGFFPREGFPALYSGADACVFPSVQEGAGLPVIEAMASGIPVASSSAGALSETSGGAALLFDSDNIEEMSYAIERVVREEETRRRLITAGLEWSKRFNWDDTAEKTVGILCSLFNN